MEVFVWGALAIYIYDYLYMYIYICIGRFFLRWIDEERRFLFFSDRGRDEMW